MSNEATYKYAEDRLTDCLREAADIAAGMGYGNRPLSDASLHAKLIAALRNAENAARIIGHDRAMKGQGIAWIRFTARLHAMVEAMTKAAEQSAFRTRNDAPKGRGPLWIRFGAILKEFADEVAKAAQQKQAYALIVGGREYANR